MWYKSNREASMARGLMPPILAVDTFLPVAALRRHGMDLPKSEEEADYPPDGDSDEDLSDMDHKEIHDEVEGSVDEDSTKSDEEYDDLAMRDGLENGYWSDNDCPESTNIKRIADDQESINEVDCVAAGEYQHNLEHIFKRSQGVVEPPLPCTLPCEINETSTGQRTRRRSLSDSMRLQYQTRAPLLPPTAESTAERPGPCSHDSVWPNGLLLTMTLAQVWLTMDSVMLNQCEDIFFLVLNSQTTRKILWNVVA
ncbi:2-phosphoglycerate kinase-related [Musa troglodytarum]|uniref:2-phosphoglycerate kinase-related n=1 Tax=Musa troglodytarum TaxID=320322 RepID=A0A9E7KJV3_9LILI|nr:2-phosphoglycerate kinase-related [Musa troglodytarum]URE20065.1 2-phosphoglycerate kinase-related [Musa troglodytarum]